MNVLVIHHSDRIGGAERSIYELVANLSSKKIKITAVLPAQGRLSELFEESGAKVLTAEIPKLKRTFNPLKLALYLKARNRLSAFARELVQSEQIDLVHYNSLSSAILFGSELDGVVPTLLHLRDSILPKSVFNQFTDKITGHIAISNYMETVLKDYLGVPPHRVFKVINGLELPEKMTQKQREKQRKALKLPDDAIVYTTAAAFVPWKNHASLFDAFKTVSKKLPNAILIICGSDLTGENDALKKKIHSTANAYGEKCRVVGNIKDIRQYLYASDVFVHPAIGEPFGRSVVEAAAVGLPSIVFDSGAMSEVVVDGETGFVSKLDVDSYANCMLAMGADRDMRARFGDAASERAHKLFSVKRTAKEIAALYRDIIAKKLPIVPKPPVITQKDLLRKKRVAFKRRLKNEAE